MCVKIGFVNACAATGGFIAESPSIIAIDCRHKTLLLSFDVLKESIILFCK
jgi:hypothetical protein